MAHGIAAVTGDLVVLTEDRQISVFVIGGLNYGSKDTIPFPN